MIKFVNAKRTIHCPLRKQTTLIITQNQITKLELLLFDQFGFRKDSVFRLLSYQFQGSLPGANLNLGLSKDFYLFDCHRLSFKITLEINFVATRFSNSTYYSQ